MGMNSLGWIVPSHKPRIEYLSTMIESFNRYSFGVDLIIVWSYKTDSLKVKKIEENANVKHIYLDDFFSTNDIFLMEKTRSIINIKKLLAVQQFYMYYKGLVCTDDEVEFYRRFTGDFVIEHFLNQKFFPATNISKVKSKDDILAKILAECIKFLPNESERKYLKSKTGDLSVFSWFSDLPYYDSNKVKSFLESFSLSEPSSLLKLSFHTFDHILYQFYCILNYNYEYYIFEWDYKKIGIYNWFECFHLSTYDTSYAKEYQGKFSPLWCSSSELKSIFFSSFCLFHTDRANNTVSKAKKIRYHLKEIVNQLKI